jgi:hypothetical protein
MLCVPNDKLALGERESRANADARRVHLRQQKVDVRLADDPTWSKLARQQDFTRELPT